MNCEEIEKKLSDYIEGRLDPANAKTVQDHVFTCTRCQAEVQVLAHTRRVVSQLPLVEPLPGSSQRVMSRIREEDENTTLWRRLFWPLKLKIPIQAMTLILVAGLVMYLYQVNEPVQKEMAEFKSSESSPALEQEALPAVPVAPAPALQEQRAQEEATGTTGRQEQKRASGLSAKQEKTAISQPDRIASAGEQSSETSGLKPVLEGMAEIDYQLVLISKGGQKNVAKRLQDLVKELNGTVTQPYEGPPGARRDSPDKPLLDLPQTQTFWIGLPRDHYDRFKTELALLGTLLSEKQTHPISLQDSSSAFTKIQLIIQYPKSP